MLSLKIFKSLDEVPVTPLEWNQLVSQSETNTVFQTYEWFQCWWKVFGAQNHLLLIIVYHNQELVGIAPLMILGGYPKRVMKFVGDGKADYCDFIISREKKAILSIIMKHIFSISHQWDSIVLTNIPGYSLTAEVLYEVSSHYRYGNKFLSRIVNICPTLVIQGNQEEIIRLINRPTLKRRYNYFKNNGDLKFINISNPEHAQKYLEVFFQQHIKRWNFRGASSLFNDQDNRNFYYELTRSLLDKQWLLFSVLEYDGVPIAFHYGFDYNSKLIWYKPSFDIDYFRRSPGKVLLRFLIDYTLENNKSEFDFTIGDELFKNEFANQKRNNLQIKIFKYRTQHLFEGVFSYLRLAIKRRSAPRRVMG